MAAKLLVLVTGPSGFVGAHVLASLLTANYRVRGTLRSDRHINFLKSKYESEVSNHDLELAIVPDLQAPGALDSIVKDVDYICHVASPHFLSTTDPWKEFLKRIVVLSSFASVNDINNLSRPGYMYTEKDWNPVTEVQAHENGNTGYFASKTFAERAAWEVLDKQKPKWDLVTFCPPMIYGPPTHEVDASKGFITTIAGKNPDFAPKVAVPRLPASVDVRDVAAAHVKALDLPEGNSERFLLCQGSFYIEDGMEGLRLAEERGIGEVGETIDRSKHYSLDVSKAEGTLGLKWIPFNKTVEDTWAKAKELGIVD